MARREIITEKAKSSMTIKSYQNKDSFKRDSFMTFQGSRSPKVQGIDMTKLE
jgi:hypothetical protein